MERERQTDRQRKREKERQRGKSLLALQLDEDIDDEYIINKRHKTENKNSMIFIGATQQWRRKKERESVREYSAA